MKYTVSIVIPNRNGKHLMKQYLPSVVGTSENQEIIVVDDHSSDDSVEFLKKYYPSIRVIENRSDRGFSSSANAGVAASKGDIVILLNTDIEPETGYMQHLVTLFDDAHVFAVGCMDKSIEEGKIIMRGRGIGEWVKGFFVHRRGEINGSDTAWVSGGSGAFRRSYWNMLGGMDPLYNPFYWEDIDIAYRAKRAGCITLFEPKSIVKHYHEEGNIRQTFTADEIHQIAYRNQFIFIWKNATLLQLLSNFVWFPYRILKMVVHGDTLILKGWFDACARIPDILTSRRKNNIRIGQLKKLLKSY